VVVVDEGGVVAPVTSPVATPVACWIATVLTRRALLSRTTSPSLAVTTRANVEVSGVSTNGAEESWTGASSFAKSDFVPRSSTFTIALALKSAT